MGYIKIGNYPSIGGALTELRRGNGWVVDEITPVVTIDGEDTLTVHIKAKKGAFPVATLFPYTTKRICAYLDDDTCIFSGFIASVRHDTAGYTVTVKGWSSKLGYIPERDDLADKGIVSARTNGKLYATVFNNRTTGELNGYWIKLMADKQQRRFYPVGWGWDWAVATKVVTAPSAYLQLNATKGILLFFRIDIPMNAVITNASLVLDCRRSGAGNLTCKVRTTTPCSFLHSGVYGNTAVGPASDATDQWEIAPASGWEFTTKRFSDANLVTQLNNVRANGGHYKYYGIIVYPFSIPAGEYMDVRNSISAPNGSLESELLKYGMAGYDNPAGCWIDIEYEDPQADSLFFIKDFQAGGGTGYISAGSTGTSPNLPGAASPPEVDDHFRLIPPMHEAFRLVLNNLSTYERYLWDLSRHNIRDCPYPCDLLAGDYLLDKIRDAPGFDSKYDDDGVFDTGTAGAGWLVTTPTVIPYSDAAGSLGLYGLNHLRMETAANGTSKVYARTVTPSASLRIEFDVWIPTFAHAGDTQVLDFTCYIGAGAVLGFTVQSIISTNTIEFTGTDETITFAHGTWHHVIMAVAGDDAEIRVDNHVISTLVAGEAHDIDGIIWETSSSEDLQTYLYLRGLYISTDAGTGGFPGISALNNRWHFWTRYNESEPGDAAIDADATVQFNLRGRSNVYPTVLTADNVESYEFEYGEPVDGVLIIGNQDRVQAETFLANVIHSTVPRIIVDKNGDLTCADELNQRAGQINSRLGRIPVKGKVVVKCSAHGETCTKGAVVFVGIGPTAAVPQPFLVRSVAYLFGAPGSIERKELSLEMKY